MVCIVDDDLSVRRAVRRLLCSAGYTVETYGSAREFLDAEPEGRTALALVDVKMEGMTGFDLQEVGREALGHPHHLHHIL